MEVFENNKKLRFEYLAYMNKQVEKNGGLCKMRLDSELKKAATHFMRCRGYKGFHVEHLLVFFYDHRDEVGS